MFVSDTGTGPLMTEGPLTDDGGGGGGGSGSAPSDSSSAGSSQGGASVRVYVHSCIIVYLQDIVQSLQQMKSKAIDWWSFMSYGAGTSSKTGPLCFSLMNATPFSAPYVPLLFYVAKIMSSQSLVPFMVVMGVCDQIRSCG